MPLSLTAPPQFQETPPLVLEVKELEAVTLRCVARGSPQPYVTWKFRGRDLGKGQGQVQVSGSAGSGGPNGKAREGQKPSLEMGRRRGFHWLPRGWGAASLCWPSLEVQALRPTKQEGPFLKDSLPRCRMEHCGSGGWSEAALETTPAKPPAPRAALPTPPSCWC